MIVYLTHFCIIIFTIITLILVFNNRLIIFVYEFNLITKRICLCANIQNSDFNVQYHIKYVLFVYTMLKYE